MDREVRALKTAQAMDTDWETRTLADQEKIVLLIESRTGLVELLREDRLREYCAMRGSNIPKTRDEIYKEIVDIESQLAPYGLV